ncbi:hypothetical protein RRG08_027776 [Elysia crispata]|uniref:Uncharacterized protein n=1 Tax=Elysia crispata TaxID=231223 RepID=A0AAE1DC71_9GAST|nr:hypothetical protein RRG08_027776 [Elysia crispata]
MPMRRRTPVMVVPRSHTYSSPRHDYGIEDSIHRADYLSSAVLEDTYDAATRSRGKDKDLLRNVNSAIQRPSRDSTPSYRHRYHTLPTPAKRFHSLPPTDHKTYSSTRTSKTSFSPTSGALVPYHRSSVKKSPSSYADDLPSPTSLLSSKISGFLKGASVPPRPLSSSVASNIAYKSMLGSGPHDDVRSHKTYSDLAMDPAVSRLLSKPSVSGLTSDYEADDVVPKYRALPSPYVSSGGAAPDYGSEEEDEDGYEPYKRKYRIIRGSAINSGDDGKTEYESDDDYESYGTYTCPRPSNSPLLKLSSYDGDYDGTYDADMAEMYDYVPFGPSKHGIFELTHHERDADSYAADSSSPSLPSTTPVYLPPIPSVTSLSSGVTLPSPMIDSLVSSTAAKARQILRDSSSSLPDYKDASLVLSVEGSAVSEDGKNRYGFRYYPPPIPLKGGGASLGLDERILGIVPPLSGASSADSFLTGYLERLRNIRAETRHHVDRGDYARGRSVAPISYSSTPSYRSTSSPYRQYSSPERYTSPYSYSSPPSVSMATLSSPYSHSTIHVPVHLAGRSTSVPVSSYRSRPRDGVSHRVDVYPLVESEARLPSGRHLQLTGGSGGMSPEKLTVLEKINIKISTEVHESPKSAVVSRRVRAASVPPRATSVPPSTRPLGYQAHAQKIKVSALQRPRPVVVPHTPRPVSAVFKPPLLSSPDAQSTPPPSFYFSYDPPDNTARSRDSHFDYYNYNSSLANPNQPSSSKPVVLRQGAVDKTPWYIERSVRARSVALEQAAPKRAARGASMPPGGNVQHRSKVPPLHLPPAPLPTSGMKATRRQPPAYEAAMLRARARSLERGGSLGAGPPSTPVPAKQLGPLRSATLRKTGLRRAASEPRLVERGENSQHSYYYTALPASHKYYHRVPDASERALSRHLYSHRGRFGPDSKPPRPSLAGFPQVYVPWTGPGPSNRAKAAIIGSKMEPERRSGRKGPRSQYAQNKMREMHLDDIQESVFARAPSTGNLHASRPPLPKLTERKAIRDVDGFTKPKNLMSWEHRLESRLNPSDIIYEPSSLIRMRQQVKDVQEKMDRQRQLLDRYLDKDLPPTITSRAYENHMGMSSCMPCVLRRYSRLVSVSPEPRLYSRATSLPPASLPRRSVRSPSVAPVLPAIYYREVSMPPERRLSLYSRESSVLSEPQTTIRAQSVPRFVPALPTPRAILLSSGYQPYVRMYHRPVVSYRPTPARFVVRPTRPVMRPVMRKRKSRKIRVVKNPVRDILADPLPPIPHLKQWSASPRVLARPWVPSTRMFPLEESEGGPPATAGGDPDNRPMSELRRKLRRTLAKSKNNPDYFKE